jgi:hypothetical protein
MPAARLVRREVAEYIDARRALRDAIFAGIVRRPLSTGDPAGNEALRRWIDRVFCAAESAESVDVRQGIWLDAILEAEHHLLGEARPVIDVDGQPVADGRDWSILGVDLALVERARETWDAATAIRVVPYTEQEMWLFDGRRAPGRVYDHTEQGWSR